MAVAGTTVLVAEVLGCMVAVAEARLAESGRTDWIRAMSVSLVLVAGTLRHVQYHCS